MKMLREWKWIILTNCHKMLNFENGGTNIQGSILYVLLNILSIFTFSKQAFNDSIDFFLQPFIASWIDINLIDNCQAHLPVQYASNIEFIHQKWHWCCDWQRATPRPHVQNKRLVCFIGCPFYTGRSAFPFYTPTKPLIRKHIKYKIVFFLHKKYLLCFRFL